MPPTDAGERTAGGRSPLKPPSTHPSARSRSASPVGARRGEDGVRYRVWAPDHDRLVVRIQPAHGRERRLPLEADEAGYFSGNDLQGSAGDRYLYELPDGAALPDPASRFQPDGVHGWSECVDSQAFRWRATDWRRPRWKGQAVYELHVGTFTPAGTFLAAVEQLDHVAALGVDAIELMPVADFPGARNWGYDGVALFAPARCYGRPDDLRALVDAAHARGLAVVLDVVYNHLGPDGNYLGRYARAYFAADRQTPWGQGFRLAGPGSEPVRAFFLENALYWIDEFRIDGLRLDATHAIEDDSPCHLLAEIAAAVQARGAWVIAEDERNTCGLLRRPDGTGCGLDAVWADDFHHQVRVALTGTKDGYLNAYDGRRADLARTLTQGWFYSGEPYTPWNGRPRGEPCAHLPPSAFVYCIENHDQIGNRAKGERLEHLVGAAAFRAASALLCLTPYPPLLFMGQEWAAGTPFLFFTDHHGELGPKVTAGRRQEFAAFGHDAKGDPDNVPDPQQLETFLRSKLRWEERCEPSHASTLALYRDCLRQRREWLHGVATERKNWEVLLFERAVAIRYAEPGMPVRVLIFSLHGGAGIEGVVERCGLRSAGTTWAVLIDSRPDAGATAERRADLPVTLLLVAQKTEGTAG